MNLGLCLVSRFKKVKFAQAGGAITRFVVSCTIKTT